MPYLGKMNIKAGIESDGDNVHLNRGSLRVTGKVTSGVRVLLKDNDDKILLATGTTVPSGTAGYAKGCLFIDTDVVAGSQGLYENVGTTTVCNFNLIGAIAAGEITLAQGSILLGNASGVAAATDAKTSGQILVGSGTTLASVAVSGDATLAANGALTIAPASVENSMLAAGAGVGALLTAGLGGSVSIVKTDADTHTIIAANATKDRACLVLVVVDETYAIGTGTLPTVQIGEADTINKCMADTVLDTEAAGTVLAFAFTNSATKAIIATSTAAVGDATGGCSITVIAIPTT